MVVRSYLRVYIKNLVKCIMSVCVTSSKSLYLIFPFVPRALEHRELNQCRFTMKDERCLLAVSSVWKPQDQSGVGRCFVFL